MSNTIRSFNTNYPKSTLGVVPQMVAKPWLAPKNNDYPIVNASEHDIGKGIYGQDNYPVTPKTEPELYDWNQKIWKVGKEHGLDPFDTRFWIMQRDTLLQTAARSGFPVRYRHWSFGQAYQELLMPQKHGLANLYELVINNDPCYAYLLKENPLYAQKVVMAHVMGHSDFFKNNYMFNETNRQMLNRTSNIASSINGILDSEKVTVQDLENFIEKVHSIQWLIDLTAKSPKKLNLNKNIIKEPEKLPDNWGKIDTSSLPSHMDKRINYYTRISKEVENEEIRRETITKKNPPEPERDVLAFLIENSVALKPWQRKVLSLLREESYYFAPQLQTKIMNEGWASFWHTNIMKHRDVIDLENATSIGKMFGNVLALQKFNLNPYALGIEIFKDIEDRWNKGHHGTEWETIRNMEEKENYGTKEMKGREKVFEVRKNYNDIQFLRTFFTKDIANKLKMYTWNTSGNDVEISSKDFEDIKNRLLEMLDNGGQPLIQVVDSNHLNRGEIVLKHSHTYDLKQDYAEMTLENIKSLWGRPAHLDTYKTSSSGTKKPMRISITDSEGTPSKNVIKRYILKDNGAVDYECDAKGDRLYKNSGVYPYLYAGI